MLKKGFTKCHYREIVKKAIEFHRGCGSNHAFDKHYHTTAFLPVLQRGGVGCNSDSPAVPLNTCKWHMKWKGVPEAYPGNWGGPFPGQGYACPMSSTSMIPKRPTKQTRQENIKLIAKLLGISPEEISPKRVPTTSMNEEKARQALKVLNDFGFSNSSVVTYPSLLLMTSSAMENYIRIMNESCFPDVRDALLLKFSIFAKQTMQVLQTELKLPKLDVIVNNYCLELEMDDSFRDEFLNRLPKNTERLTLLDLRCEMIASYLSKLSLGNFNELKKVFSKYPRLTYRSFNWIKRNYRTLKELNFTEEKIQKHLYLLHADPNNMEKVIALKSLGGMEIRVICWRRPKILMSAYETLNEIEKSLIDHNISFTSVYTYPELYTLSAETIKHRLQEIDNTPELRLLKKHPRVARILYYYNKVKLRLKLIEEDKGTRVPSLHLLSTDSKRFENSFANRGLQGKGVDSILYLVDVLQIERKRIGKSLKRHPYWLNVPLINMKPTIEFIMNSGPFTKEQLLDAIPLFLYPVEKVQKAMDDVIQNGSASKTDYYFLQMVLYVIEQPSHFSGDGVWRIKAHEYEDAENEEVQDDEIEMQEVREKLY